VIEKYVYIILIMVTSNHEDHQFREEYESMNELRI